MLHFNWIYYSSELHNIYARKSAKMRTKYARLLRDQMALENKLKNCGPKV